MALKGNFRDPGCGAVFGTKGRGLTQLAPGKPRPDPILACPNCDGLAGPPDYNRNAGPVPFAMLQIPASIETRSSWLIAGVALTTLMMSSGAAWITAVGLKDIAADAGARSVPALASALAWLGSGVGGIILGQVADRVGTRWTVACGALMILAGLWLSSLGPSWPLWIGHGLFIGLIGLGGINAPLYVYVSRWFDRRRGSALALISSGNYLGGVMWPPLVEHAISTHGWRATMEWYGVLECLVVLPLALIFLRTPPDAPKTAAVVAPGHASDRVIGLPPNLVFATICGATLLCCIPMAIPHSHLIAFCTDLGVSRATGAAMLSVLLGSAFLTRQFWGAMADRVGGLPTLLAGSALQCLSMVAFLFTQSEAGLFTVASLFGLGYSGIIPAYILTVRELFPANEASWRVPTVLFSLAIGMALGGWLAGALYDSFGYYAPAFTIGIGTNSLNILIIGLLVTKQRASSAQKKS